MTVNIKLKQHSDPQEQVVFYHDWGDKWMRNMLSLKDLYFPPTTPNVPAKVETNRGGTTENIFISKKDRK